jgi:hypothetical protein
VESQFSQSSCNIGIQGWHLVLLVPGTLVVSAIAGRSPIAVYDHAMYQVHFQKINGINSVLLFSTYNVVPWSLFTFLRTLFQMKLCQIRLLYLYSLLWLEVLVRVKRADHRFFQKEASRILSLIPCDNQKLRKISLTIGGFNSQGYINDE